VTRAVDRDPGLLVRRGLVALTAVGVVAAAFDLYGERHWNGPEQFVPWVALAVLAVATVMVLVPGPGARGTARVLALLVLGASVYGVVDHILINYDAGELDQRFADTWATLPVLTRWWYAVSKQVGPAPTLAPGVLGQTAVLLLLATVGGPLRPVRQ
jgi:hypothetical protein